MSTIPTIAPALRLVGATPGAETKQIKLVLKLSSQSISVLYIQYFLLLTDNAIPLKMLKVAYLFVFTKYQLYSKVTKPTQLVWTSAGLKPLTYVEH